MIIKKIDKSKIGNRNPFQFYNHTATAVRNNSCLFYFSATAMSDGSAIHRNPLTFMLKRQ